MSERFQQKAADLYHQHKVDAGGVEISQDLLEQGTAQRQALTERQALRSEAIGELSVGAAKTLVKSNEAKLSDEIKQTEEVDEQRLQDARDSYDKSLKKGAKHYNRRWNKGRYQKSALKDAKKAGVDIKGWK